MKLYSSSKDFPAIFENGKRKILEVFKDCKIYHVGSTAVPGLGGKGIIDILITIDDWGKEEELIEKLKGLGFSHIHEREDNRRFLSREVKDDKLKETHLHIVKEGSKEEKEIIAFKDYLISNPQEAKKYHDVKLKLKEEDPEEYSERKGECIGKILKKALFRE